MNEQKNQTKQDLHRGYADLLDLTGGVDIGLTKLDGNVIDSPFFNSGESSYELALGVIEDKALFAGDVFYVNGNKVTAESLYQSVPRVVNVRYDSNCALCLLNIEQSSGRTWNPPSLVFKRGEPVFVRNADNENYLPRYFSHLSGKHFVVSYEGADVWSGRICSSFTHCRKLTPEELADHDKLVNAWRE